MNKILNYIIRKMDSGNGIEEIELIDYMINNNQINLNSIVQLKDNKLSLKEFLLNQYKKIPNKQILSILNNQGVNVELDDEMSYATLLSVIKNIRYEHNPDKIEALWTDFLQENISVDKVISYINDSDKNNFLEYIFDKNNKYAVFLFEKVIENYLKFNNVKGIVEDYIVKEFKQLTYSKADTTIKLLNNFNYLSTIKNNDGDELIKCLFLNFPDKCMDGLINNQQKEEWIDFYFNEKIKKVDPIINNSNIYNSNAVDSNEKILVSKKEWFKTICGNEDIISVLIKDEMNKEIILKELKKSNELKDYILKRDKNLLVEYLSKSNDNALLKEYRILAKKLPELTEKENEYGILDSLITGKNNVLTKPSKFFELLNSLSLAMKITSSPERLLNWINSSPFFTMDGNINMDVYRNLFSLTLSTIDKKYENEMDNSIIKESRDKLIIQERVAMLISRTPNKFPKEEGIISIIESKSFNFNASQLKNFTMIKDLMSQNKINKNYLNSRLIDEEKEMIKRSLSTSSDLNVNVSKKRI